MYSSMMLFISGTCCIRIKCFIYCFYPPVIVAFTVSYSGQHHFYLSPPVLQHLWVSFKALQLCQTVLFHLTFIALMLKVLTNIIALVMLKKKNQNDKTDTM